MFVDLDLLFRLLVHGYFYYLIRVRFTQAINPACSCVVYESRGRTSGTFTSPNFPDAVPNKIDCLLYNFVGQSDELVELIFHELDIHISASSNRCSTDYVRTYMDLTSPAVSDGYQWNHEICGNVSAGAVVGLRLEQPLQPLLPRSTLAVPYWASPVYSLSSFAMLELHTSHHSSRHHSTTTIRPHALSIPLSSTSSYSTHSRHVGFRGSFNFIPREKFQMVGGSKRWGSRCTYDFFSSNTTKEGRLFSEKYPQDYPAQLVCSYVFLATPGELIRITFHTIRLDLPPDATCSRNTDYVAVYDGTDATATRLRLYCAEADNVIVTSSSDRLYIEFVSDDRGESQGFAASFKYLPAKVTTSHRKFSPSVTQSPMAEMKGTQTVGYTSAIKPMLFTVDANNADQNTSPSCDREVTSASSSPGSGTITSPGYPDSYPGDITCRYVFIGRQKERVQLKFSQFTLHYEHDDATDPYECDEVDVIVVGFLVSPLPSTRSRLCGNKLPPMMMSSDNRAALEFISRARATEATDLRFSFDYRFVTDFGIKVGDRDRSKGCHFTIKSSKSPSGTFTSPNYPGLYPRNTECHYIFIGGDLERVQLTIIEYDVDGIPPSCSDKMQSDYIELSNFNIDLTDRKLQRLCGKAFGYRIQSDGSFFRVTFKSNDVYEATGFNATYQFNKTHQDETRSDKRTRETGGKTTTVGASQFTVIMVATFAVFLTSYLANPIGLVTAPGAWHWSNWCGRRMVSTIGWL